MLTENGFTFSKVIMAIGRCDLRKGIDGLAAMVRLKYGLDPLEKGTLFLFCGTKRDRIKGILWTGDRFILLYIRLAEGNFQWPRTAEEARRITPEEFKRLMDGFSIDPSVGPRRARPVNDPKSRRKR
ncbi:MAG: IS66 family insertion sequence element accessory protein TnpB [Lachnospiraceae bacterium]|nr:IS66 family insertion sequence element accessory protein TnpB [Lachnospiraceae bacterium]